MTMSLQMRTAKFFRAGVLAAMFLGSTSAWAYEETAVSNGGTVRGAVRFIGELPPPLSFELRRYPDRVYCGGLSDGSGYRRLRTVSVGDQQGLKDVIVTIEGVEKGKPFVLSETRIDANICQFVPFVSVMPWPMTSRSMSGKPSTFSSCSIARR
jgi:hypothetical protein